MTVSFKICSRDGAAAGAVGAEAGAASDVGVCIFDREATAAAGIIIIPSQRTLVVQEAKLPCASAMCATRNTPEKIYAPPPKLSKDYGGGTESRAKQGKQSGAGAPRRPKPAQGAGPEQDARSRPPAASEPPACRAPASRHNIIHPHLHTPQTEHKHRLESTGCHGAFQSFSPERYMQMYCVVTVCGRRYAPMSSISTALLVGAETGSCRGVAIDVSMQRRYSAALSRVSSSSGGW